MPAKGVGGTSKRSTAAAGGVSGLPAAPIPDKLYFRIGEVADLCQVEPFVLRYWQSEFPQLRPGKSGTGQRLYRRRDVETALRIKTLLHDQGYTIAGARQVLAADRAALAAGKRAQPELPLHSGSPDATEAQRAADRAQARLARLRVELRELLGMLSEPPRPPRPRRGKDGRGSEEPGPRLFTDG